MSPDPLFLSQSFPVENRPGLSDQSMELVVRELLRILRGADLEIGDVGTWPSRIREDVQRWLSDWHLVAFLAMHGPFSPKEAETLAHAATAHKHPEHKGALEELFRSGGWQTLLTIAESSGSAMDTNDRFSQMGIASPQRSGTGASTPATGGAGAAAAAEASGPKACPHCTFINEPGNTDCDVCGLPLNG